MLGLSEMLSDQQLRLGALLAARAEDDPAAPALRLGGEVLSRGALLRRIAAVAARLEAAGLNPGDRILLRLEPSAGSLVLLLAALACEAVAVPVDAARPERDLAALLAHLEPRLLARPAARPDGAWPEGVAIEPGPGGAPEESGLPAGRQPALILPAAGEAPRGVVLSHRGLAWNAALVAQERRYREGDLLFVGRSLADPAALVEVLAMLQAGGQGELAAPAPAALAAALAPQGASAMLAPAEALERLAEEAGRGDLARHRLRLLLLPEPVAEARAARLAAAFGLAPAISLVLPEAGPVVAFPRPGQELAHGSAGAPLPGVELRIVDAAGETVPTGTEGELLLRHAGLMLGYWRDPAATAAAFAPGRFLRTRCRALRDAEGHLVIRERALSAADA